MLRYCVSWRCPSSAGHHDILHRVWDATCREIVRLQANSCVDRGLIPINSCATAKVKSWWRPWTRYLCSARYVLGICILSLIKCAKMCTRVRMCMCRKSQYTLNGGYLEIVCDSSPYLGQRRWRRLVINKIHCLILLYHWRRQILEQKMGQKNISDYLIHQWRTVIILLFRLPIIQKFQWKILCTYIHWKLI